MGRFLFGFVTIGALLFAAELSPPGQRYIADPWTHALAVISGALVQAFDPSVLVHGRVLESPAARFGVSIEAGCNGLEATIILAAAVLAFPAPWRSRGWGLVAGVIAIQGLNVIRVISLFYLGQWHMAAFEFAHRYLWQALIMLDVLIVWLLWVRTLPAAPRDAGVSSGVPPPAAA